jgi:hypothetical protein
MVWAGLALVLGLTALPLGRLAAWPAWPFNAYGVALAPLFANVPSAALYSIQLGMPPSSPHGDLSFSFFSLTCFAFARRS